MAPSVFVIGRRTKGECRLLVLHPATPPPFPGPWELRAVVPAR